jgi:hypothetical protein
MRPFYGENSRDLANICSISRKTAGPGTFCGEGVKLNMKRYLLLLVLLSALPAAPQEPSPLKLEVVTSEAHSLYYLLECLIDTPHRSPQIANTFRSRVGNWFPVQVAIADWKKTLEEPSLSLLRFPEVQGRTPEISQVLEKVALQSNGAAEIAERAAPWLGPDAATDFRTALETLEPLHERYWWAPRPMEEARTGLLDALRRGRFEDRLGQAMAFYQGELPTNTARVALIPYRKGVGETKSHTRGHNSGDLQVFEVVLGQNQDDRAGVCFHEFCHSLWGGQDEGERQRWEERFFRHGLWGRLAYVQLNEGLATAVGNGWFHQKVTGEVAQDNWYADPVIDTYGKALYPVVTNALDQSRPPTDKELDGMVKAFRESLPEADRTFDVVAANFLTVTSREEAHRSPFQSELMRLGPVRESGVRGWDAESDDIESFTLYWLKPDEDFTISGMDPVVRLNKKDPVYALRRSEHGWKLAFSGEHDDLFSLLRRLQKEGLTESP